MEDFIINGIRWHIQFVNVSSSKLTRTDGSRTVGMTDWNTHTVYLASNLQGDFLDKVLCHELCHCICFSYDIQMDIEQEEFLADWVSLYGRQVIELLDNLLYKTSRKGLKCV